MSSLSALNKGPAFAGMMAAALAALSACDAPPKPDTQAPVRVLTYSVGTSNETGTAYAGTIKARVEQNLAFRVGGKIIERRVNLGERVSAGQLLMRLDPLITATA